MPVDPHCEDAEMEEQWARLCLQEDLDQAAMDGFPITTDISFT